MPLKFGQSDASDFVVFLRVGLCGLLTVSPMRRTLYSCFVLGRREYSCCCIIIISYALGVDLDVEMTFANPDSAYS